MFAVLGAMPGDALTHDLLAGRTASVSDVGGEMDGAALQAVLVELE